MAKLDVRFFDAFINGTLNTLRIQCSVETTPSRAVRKGDAPPFDCSIAGIIGITSNSFKGTMTLSFTESAFLGIMSSMLGEDFKEITKDLQDGACELLNIIFGQAKVTLNEQGHGVQMAIPSIIRGTKLEINSMSKGIGVVLPFATKFGEFRIEFCTE